MPRIVHRIVPLAVLALGAAFNSPAHAQAWPSKPFRMIVSYAPGGAADITSRAITDKFTQRLGQPVIMDYRPGASTLIGLEATAKAAPDGYTMAIFGNSMTWVNQVVKTNFDPRRDLDPITMIRSASLVAWISATVPVKTVQEFIAYAKANPTKLNYGSNGAGNGNHLAVESLKLIAPGLSGLVHVPFKSEAPIAVALAAGEIQFAMGTYLSFVPHVASGKVRALAVPTTKRQPALPQTPTFVESGVQYVDSYWTGLWAPAGTPRDIRARIASEMKAIFALPDVIPVLLGNGEEPGGQTPEEFAKIISDEIEMRTRAVRAAGLKPG